jgi:hypothetical protein
MVNQQKPMITGVSWSRWLSALRALLLGDRRSTLCRGVSIWTKVSQGWYWRFRWPLSYALLREIRSLGCGGEEELNWVKEGGDGEVSEKSLRNEAISGFPVPGRDRDGPFLPCRSRLGWKDKKTAPTGATGRTLARDQEDKMEILAY